MAVRENGFALQFINDPSRKIQLEAVRQNGNAIQYINNPSKSMKLEAIKNNIDAVEYIDDKNIKSLIKTIRTRSRIIHVLEIPNEKPLFTIGCQKNITKEYFLWRIYNLDGGLEENPHRKDYLNVLNSY